jgi:hypothetical protein
MFVRDDDGQALEQPRTASREVSPGQTPVDLPTQRSGTDRGAAALVNDAFTVGRRRASCSRS